MRITGGDIIDVICVGVAGLFGLLILLDIVQTFAAGGIVGIAMLIWLIRTIFKSD